MDDEDVGIRFLGDEGGAKKDRNVGNLKNEATMKHIYNLYL